MKVEHEGEIVSASELFPITQKRIVIEEPIELQKPNKTVVWILIIVIIITILWIIYEYKKIKHIEYIMHLPHYEKKLKKRGLTADYLKQAVKLARNAQEEGYTKEQIRNQFEKANWPKYAIEYVMNKAEEKD